MASREQIERVLGRLESACRADFYRHVSETQAGIGAVLRLLYESDGPVTAGRISEVLQISTARVAVLLKKMAVKELIIKERDTADARVSAIRLSGQGEKAFTRMRDEMYRQLGLAIDAVGEERMMEFIAISEEIRAAVEFKTPPFLEGECDPDAKQTKSFPLRDGTGRVDAELE